MFPVQTVFYLKIITHQLVIDDIQPNNMFYHLKIFLKNKESINLSKRQNYTVAKCVQLA